MRKFGVLSSTVFICTVLAGLYGILHDQITYSISAEYFTRFKYRQFGLQPAWFGGHRPTVAVIGFLATWWTGTITGIVLGFSGLIYKDHRTMKQAINRAIGLVFGTAVLSGFLGFLYGRFRLVKTGVSWWLPDHLTDKNSFIIVGSIHNFSYLGGLTGLFMGVIFLFRNYRRTKAANIS